MVVGQQQQGRQPQPEQQPPPIALAHGQVQQVQEFTYLGSLLHASGSMQPEVSRRMCLAGKAFRQLRPVLSNRFVSLATRLRIYKAIVIPTLTYGAAEAWAPTLDQMRQIDAFNTSCLRTIINRPTRDNMTISNVELYHETQHPAITHLLRKHRLRWLGHLARMPSSTQPKQLLFATAPARAPGRTYDEIRRPPGGLAQAWPRIAGQDLAVVMKKGDSWFTKCQDRPAWRRLAATAIPDL
jgi:hypothetical protein